MITGAHFLLYSENPEADRAFLRDVMELISVDLGRGWLIFAMPPAEMAVHPAGAIPPSMHGERAIATAVLYWMCDDLDETMRTLGVRGATFTDVTTEQWGRKTTMRLPSGAELGLYQPSHETALGLR